MNAIGPVAAAVFRESVRDKVFYNLVPVSYTHLTLPTILRV